MTEDARLRDIREVMPVEQRDPDQHLRLACLQIVGRLNVRADPRECAEDLVVYVKTGVIMRHCDICGRRAAGDVAACVATDCPCRVAEAA